MSETCVYGLNANNALNFDKICFNSSDLTVSYDASVSSDFFSQFANGQDIDYLWVLIAGALVFFMQCGFTLLEAGAIKSSNVQNILFKNTMDACIGSLVWFLFGYCVAYGDSDSKDANPFIGVENIVLENEDWNGFFFQWAFAATAATIVSGSVAERCSLTAYFTYTVFITVWVYPCVVHWMWDSHGWLSPFSNNPKVFNGVIDFAGSGVVHMVGGFSGLAGAYMCGPRFRRFDDSDEAKSSKYFDELKHQFKFGHNVPFQVFGTFILWTGWYGFNCGSTLAANGVMHLASRVAVTTTLAAASGGIVCAFLAKMHTRMQDEKKEGYWSIPAVCNGILAGLVSITAGCATIQTGWAIFVGSFGALLYYSSSNMLEKLRIDDPLDAFSVHGACGTWGVLAAALFAIDKDYIDYAYGSTIADTPYGERLLAAIVAVLVIAGWTLVNSGMMFGILKKIGILTVDEHVQRSGLDEHEHGGKAVSFGKVYSDAKKPKHQNEQKSDN
jgi:Amt family ammonium transporter